MVGPQRFRDGAATEGERPFAACSCAGTSRAFSRVSRRTARVRPLAPARTPLDSHRRAGALGSDIARVTGALPS